MELDAVREILKIVINSLRDGALKARKTVRGLV